MFKYRRDITGLRCNRLIVLGKDNRSDVHSYKWECQCDCGNICYNTAYHLLAGSVQSCGCAKRDALLLRNRINNPAKRKTHEHHIRAYVYNKLRHRGRALEISADDAYNLAIAPCHYCGASLSNAVIAYDDSIRYNGVDRVDSALGYIEGNCVSCCWQCNRAKSAMSVDEFLSFIDRVYKFQESKNEKPSNARILSSKSHQAFGRSWIQSYMPELSRE